METSRKAIQEFVVELINSYLAPKGLHLEKHEESLQGYFFVDVDGEHVTISDDMKNDFMAFFKQSQLSNCGIGQSFNPDEHYLLLSFARLKC